MKRSQAIAIPIGVLLFMLLAFVVVSVAGGLPSDGQRRLDAYLDQHLPGDRPDYQAVKAEYPDEFIAETSGAVYGNSVYYQTVDNAGETEELPSLTDAGNLTGGSLRPVPYPPVELWCIGLLDENGQQSTILFLALHQDLYNADWLIHTPATDVQRLLNAVGCPTSYTS